MSEDRKPAGPADGAPREDAPSAKPAKAGLPPKTVRRLPNKMVGPGATRGYETK